MRSIYFLLCISILPGSVTLAQDTLLSKLIQSRQYIDSICTVIDFNTSLSTGSLVGNSELGEFKQELKYLASSKEIVKSTYQFNPDSAGTKTFYYQQKLLIKLIDRGKSFYYFKDDLYDTQGIPLERSRTIALLQFEFTYRNLAQSIIR